MKESFEIEIEVYEITRFYIEYPTVNSREFVFYITFLHNSHFGYIKALFFDIEFYQTAVTLVDIGNGIEFGMM